MMQHPRFREEILHGLSEIAQPGVPGGVAIFGPSAFPIFTSSGDPPVAVGAGATYGKGRAILLSHDGFIGRDWTSKTWAPFVHRCIDWVRQGGPRTGVILWTGGNEQSPESILRHISNGGGCVAAMCPWGFLQIHKGKVLADLSINRAFSHLGLVLIDGYFEGVNDTHTLDG